MLSARSGRVAMFATEMDPRYIEATYGPLHPLRPPGADPSEAPGRSTKNSTAPTLRPPCEHGEVAACGDNERPPRLRKSARPQLARPVVADAHRLPRTWRSQEYAMRRPRTGLRLQTPAVEGGERQPAAEQPGDPNGLPRQRAEPGRRQADRVEEVVGLLGVAGQLLPSAAVEHAAALRRQDEDQVGAGG